MRRSIATLAVGAALLAPGSAIAAGNSTCQAYNPQLCNVTPHNSPSASSGTLPFTGLDAGLLALGGGTLLGTGFVVRRLTRRID